MHCYRALPNGEVYSRMLPCVCDECISSTLDQVPNEVQCPNVGTVGAWSKLNIRSKLLSGAKKTHAEFHMHQKNAFLDHIKSVATAIQDATA
mmetsp:Transcript_28763/g.37121  ORF Transcript_28763/g.37121 Transcript_28763/m.37121 type:complete len:92 (+) Transcript_28763:489-764(+)